MQNFLLGLSPLDTEHLALIIIAIISGVISPVLLVILKYFLYRKDKKKDCSVTKTLKNEELITYKLEFIREKINADRVWLAEFHNGGHLFTGKGVQKFSQTYEAVGRGISSESLNTQNLPTSLFSVFFTNLIAKKHIYIKNTKDTDQLTNFMQGFLESRNIKSLLAFQIVNIKQQFIGFLCIDFVSQNIEIDDNTVLDLKHDVSVIAGYLENLFN